MREIKFRAWDKSILRMLYRNLFDRNWYATPANTETGSNCVQSIKPEDRTNLEVMQYTGLIDKNDVDICEGDIVKGVAEHEGHSNVFYGNGRWFPFSYLGSYMGSEYEVIGNIYENPEFENPELVGDV